MRLPVTFAALLIWIYLAVFVGVIFGKTVDAADRAELDGDR